MKKPLVWVLAGMAGTLALLGLLVLVVVYTGSYNIAATEDHMSMVRWALDTTQNTSVQRHARGLSVPVSMTAGMTAKGAAMYKDMCQHCHAGPGVRRADWASGMRPRPPQLTEAAAEWETEEVFWLAKHGIRMTGMPAFGPTHSDSDLWNLAAFVKKLPAMTAEEYAGYAAGAEGGHSHSEDGHTH